ncbi:MAG TPA: PKD domain-containing protein, partial [Solirubrobacteraceae bacterium]|nr:PKD domain-containing protein [Solirubrobacteraceae bacterium]
MRALRPTLLLTAVLLLGPGAAVVHAGPGIMLLPKDAQAVRISGAQIAQMAGPAKTYTLPGHASQPGKKVPLRGLSIGALLGSRGITAQRVQVLKRGGGSYVVTPAHFGSAMLSDDGTTTRFFRSSGGVLIDYTEDSEVPLEVSVDGGDLAIRASASRKRIKVGETVTFEAKVRFGVPGATYSYEWDFGEGPVAGKRVTHSPDLAGTLFAQVAVRNTDPGCTVRCGGTEQVTVEVGEAPEQPKDTAAGGPNGVRGGAGSAGGTGGGGTGG